MASSSSQTRPGAPTSLNLEQAKAIASAAFPDAFDQLYILVVDICAVAMISIAFGHASTLK